MAFPWRYLARYFDVSNPRTAAEQNFNRLERRAYSARPTVLDAVPPGTPVSGAPTTGTWETHDYFWDDAGIRWRCTSGGTPGTWVRDSGFGELGDMVPYLLGCGFVNRFETSTDLPSGTAPFWDNNTSIAFDTANKGTMSEIWMRGDVLEQNNNFWEGLEVGSWIKVQTMDQDDWILFRLEERVRFGGSTPYSYLIFPVEVQDAHSPESPTALDTGIWTQGSIVGVTPILTNEDRLITAKAFAAKVIPYTVPPGSSALYVTTHGHLDLSSEEENPDDCEFWLPTLLDATEDRREITINWVEGATRIPESAETMLINGDWVPSPGDCIKLVWIQRLSKWKEQYRSPSSGGEGAVTFGGLLEGHGPPSDPPSEPGQVWIYFDLDDGRQAYMWSVEEASWGEA